MDSKDKKYVEKVLNNYEEKTPTKLDELKELDKKASKGANIFAYVFGTIGALVLGFGMCVAMKIILADLMIIGIIIGILGIFMVSINYFIYKKMLENGRKKYADQIKNLSNELLNK